MPIAAMLVVLGVACSRTEPSREEIVALFEQGRVGEATELLQGFPETMSDDPELLFLYGQANMAISRPSLAVWPFFVARDDPAWSERAGIALARAAAASGDRDLVLQATDYLLDADPDKIPALQIRAEAEILLNRFDVALEHAERILDQEPKHVSAQIARLQALMGLERIDQIEEGFDELSSIWSGPDFPRDLAERYCGARAVFAHENGDSEEAERRFSECRETFPNSRTLLSATASFLDALGRHSESNAVFEAALEIEPDAFDLARILAQRLMHAGDEEAATQVLVRSAEASGPDQGAAWTELAHHYLALGAPEEAVSAWRKRLARPPEPDEKVLFSYAESLVQAHEFQEAEEIATRLPESLSALTRALVHLERREPEQALRYFDIGQRLWPNNATARYLAGIAAEQALEIDRAIEEYRQSIRIEAAETPAAYRLALIREAEGSFERARTALFHFVEGHPGDLDGRLASLRISGRLYGAEAVVRTFRAARWPREESDETLARAAESVWETGGASQAVSFLRAQPDVDFTHADHLASARVLTHSLHAARRTDEAIALARKAVEQNPQSAAAHEVLAFVLGLDGSPARDVRDAFEAALMLDPDHARSLAGLAAVAESAGRIAEARTLYARAIEADPYDFDARRREALLIAAAGDRAEAITRLEGLLADVPQDTQTMIASARLLHEHDSGSRRAVRLASTAVRFRGGAPALSTLTEILMENGAPADALTSLRRAAEHDAGPHLHYHMGRALRIAGHLGAARDSFVRAVELGAKAAFPEHLETVQAIAELSRDVRVGS